MSEPDKDLPPVPPDKPSAAGKGKSHSVSPSSQYSYVEVDEEEETFDLSAVVSEDETDKRMEIDSSLGGVAPVAKDTSGHTHVVKRRNVKRPGAAQQPDVESLLTEIATLRLGLEADRKEKEELRKAICVMTSQVSRLAEAGPVASPVRSKQRASTPRLPFQPKAPVPVQTNHRDPGDVLCSEEVRNFTLHLQNRNSLNDAVPPPVPPEDIEDFVAGRRAGPLCMRGAFYLDLHGSAASPWNARMAELFPDAFIRSGLYTTKDTDRIKEAFVSYIRSIKAQYQDQERVRLKKPKTPKALAKESLNRQTSRRHTSANHRDLACLNFMKDHLASLELVGVDGTSDDESDKDDRSSRTYRRVPLEWRSEELKNFLRALDALYLEMKHNNIGVPAKGNWPRIRLDPHPSALSSTRKPPSGLPINFFSQTYLRNLPTYVRQALNVSTTPRPLTIPDHVAEIVRRNTYSGSRARPDVPVPTTSAPVGYNFQGGTKSKASTSASTSSIPDLMRVDFDKARKKRKKTDGGGSGDEKSDEGESM